MFHPVKSETTPGQELHDPVKRKKPDMGDIKQPCFAIFPSVPQNQILKQGVMLYIGNTDQNRPVILHHFDDAT